jgi:hypothetical protein
MKDESTRKATLEIYKYNLIKEYCARHDMSVKDYINDLIKNDIIINGGEYFSNRYFKS